MRNFPKISEVLLLIAFIGLCYAEDAPPSGKRSPRRALPSVSADHYSEVLSDGTYKYAYTGEHRYVAERRLADGTIEGESLFVRPDGVPIKVHYFADKDGYRPKTEVLYKERLVSTRTVPHIREVVPVHSPPVILAPPRNGENSVNVNLGDNYHSFRGGNPHGQEVIQSNGGDVASASPSVTAIVGAGGRAIIRPDAIARTSGGSRYFRSGSGSGGDVAVANPHTTAIVGPGGSVVVEPRAAAIVGGGPEQIREVHHHTQQVVSPPQVVERIVERVPSPVRTVITPVERGYAYPVPVQVAPPQTVQTVRTGGVVLVPPSSRYSYSYGYSAPDPKHPFRDNSAYVNVNVNN